MSDRPYSQDVGTDGLTHRVFESGVEDVELKWHRDACDREVTFLSGRGWSLQVAPDLPQKITPGMKVLIPRDVWHRLLHEGSDSLQCVIREM